ncbi:MAG: tail fiber protein [Methylomicrobium sp.]|nr:tail fiber protein [Methylomicrobium sp.]
MNPATGVVPLVDQVPVGTVSYFSSATAPSGWLKANGAAISRTAYATLFSAIGVTFGAGDGASTFGLPDLRGEFIRGFDDARGIDAGRSLGSAQGDAIRNITGSVGSLVIGSRNSFTGGSGAFATSNFNNGAADSQAGSYGGATSFSFDASRQVPTAHEARPRNIALLACIKY